VVESGVVGPARINSRSFIGLCEDRASRSNLAVARQRDPGSHRGARNVAASSKDRWFGT
jgi:hypothetical protein